MNRGRQEAGSGYQLLTDDGISKMVHRFRQEQFRLQIKQISLTPYDNAIVLSDGYAVLQGKLEGQAIDDVCKYSSIDLKFAIVVFQNEDFQMRGENYFLLRHIRSVDIAPMALIGEPVPNKDYLDKVIRNSISSKSKSNVVASGMRQSQLMRSGRKRSPLRYSEDKELQQYVYIADLRMMPFGLVKDKIYAQVTKKPHTIKTFMMITLTDSVGESIECCSFGEEAVYYCRQLRQSSWYIFEKMTLQTNRKNNSLELKITSQSIVTDRFKTQMSSKKKSGARPSVVGSQRPPSWNGCLEFDVDKALEEDYLDESQYYFIMAQVKLKNKDLKPGKKRVIECFTKKSDINITLWPECDMEIVVGETYVFQFMRAKLHKGQAILCSIGKKTTVSVSSIKLNKKPIVVLDPSLFNRLQIEAALVSVQKMHFLVMQTKKRYFIVEGFLQVKIEDKSMHWMKEKLFYVVCGNCPKHKHGCRTVELINKTVVCDFCEKADRLNVLWKIKGTLMDNTGITVCKVSHEVVRKLVGQPLDALLMFFEDPTKLKEQIESKLNFHRGTFKLSVKDSLKDPKDTQMHHYFNIIENYGDEVQASLSQSSDRFGANLEDYVKTAADRQASKIPIIAIREERKNRSLEKPAKKRNSLNTLSLGKMK